MWTRTMAPHPRARRWLTPQAQKTPRMIGRMPTQLTLPLAHIWSASFPEMLLEGRTTPSKIGPLSQMSFKPSQRTVQQLPQKRIWWHHRNCLALTDQNKWHQQVFPTTLDTAMEPTGGTGTRVFLTHWAGSLEVKGMFLGRERWALRNRENY